MPHLTLTQRWILLMLAAGGTTPTIAHELGRSHESVKHHSNMIRLHYQARNRAQAVANAHRAGDL